VTVRRRDAGVKREGGRYSRGEPEWTVGALFTDPTGNPQANPMLEVANGYPGMPPVASAVTIGYAGSLPASYTLGVTDLPTSTTHWPTSPPVVRVQDSSGSVCTRVD
jgi:hypothetical protein